MPERPPTDRRLFGPAALAPFHSLTVVDPLSPGQRPFLLDPAIPINCFACGRSLRFAAMGTGAQVYHCPTDGWILLWPWCQFQRAEVAPLPVV